MDNTGRCSRCDLSEFLDVHGDGKKHRWCHKYNAFCQPVARNCTEAPCGYKKTPEFIFKSTKEE